MFTHLNLIFLPEMGASFKKIGSHTCVYAERPFYVEDKDRRWELRKIQCRKIKNFEV